MSSRTRRDTRTTGGGGGGGGGEPPPVPIPSDKDLDWNVTRDNDLPTGLWSDAYTWWILENAASGADSVFAYELESGERQPDREFELDRRNRFSHGFWSDGETVWVVDSGQDQLFAYVLETGERVEEAEFELAERNNDPRGIWSDGDIMYVVDEQDDHVYSYNIPDAIIAQLTSLSLSDLDIGEFSTDRGDYTAIAAHDAPVSAVVADATQEAASVKIEPVDADGDRENGHQVSLGAETGITITVTSGDGNRTTTYRIQVSKPPCLDGLTDERLSEVSFVGGTVSDLEACARRLEILAFYHLTDGVYVAYFLDAPEFLSQPFQRRFAAGVPTGVTLVANRKLESDANRANGDAN